MLVSHCYAGGTRGAQRPGHLPKAPGVWPGGRQRPAQPHGARTCDPEMGESGEGEGGAGFPFCGTHVLPPLPPSDPNDMG